MFVSSFLAPFLFCRCVVVASMELFVLGVGIFIARQTQLWCVNRLLQVECIMLSLVLLYASIKALFSFSVCHASCLLERT